MPTQPQPTAPSVPPLNWSAGVLPVAMLLLLFCVAASLRADDTNAFSSVVSYQYFDSLDEPGVSNTVISAVVSYQYQDSLNAPGTETTVLSPIVSYQYYDWPGDENVILQSSPKVSYLWLSEVTRLTISGAAYVNFPHDYAYTATAHFPDGRQEDVTSGVKWSSRGWPRNAIRADGTMQAWFDDPEDRPLIIRAQYDHGGGGLTAEFKIQSGFSPDLRVSMRNPDVRFLRPENSGYVWSLAGNVWPTFNAQGAVTYAWTLDGQPMANSAETLNVEVSGQPRTARLQVQATDEAGHSAVDSRKVVFNRPGLNEPGQKFPAPDPDQGEFLDSSGQPFTFYANRVQNGLIVLTHGLRGKGKDKWLQTLASGIASRLADEGKGLPNIAIFSWPEGANPRIRFGDGSDDEGFVRRLAQRTVDSAAVDFMFDIGVIRPHGISHGVAVANWLQTAIDEGRINTNAPIHLIGHSAGGFVVGAAGKILPQYVTQVTMLDTPVPVPSHFKGSPQPPRAERYISSFWGDIAPGVQAQEGPNYHDRILYSLRPLAGNGISTPTAHSYSHEWYWTTVADRIDSEREGFYYSPLLASRWPSAGGAASLKSAKAQFAEITEALTDFTTFGDVQTNGTNYFFREAGNSGLVKDMSLPIGAVALRFRYQFIGAGDGDFLTVHFGDNPALYVGSDLPLSRSSPLEIEVPLSAHAGQTGALVIKLVSRRATNAMLLVDEIKLVLSDDADGDGIPNTEEILLGTNPLARDSDDDGWTDGFEVNVSHTNPLRADTDGDGVSDADEDAAGTDPLDATSVLRMGAALNPDGAITLRWLARDDRTYRVIRSAQVDFADYEVLAFGVQGVHPVTTFTNAPAGETNVFYRILVD